MVLQNVLPEIHHFVGRDQFGRRFLHIPALYSLGHFYFGFQIRNFNRILPHRNAAEAAIQIGNCVWQLVLFCELHGAIYMTPLSRK